MEPLDFNRLFVMRFVTGMIEGKDYQGVHAEISILVAFIHGTTAFVRNPPMVFIIRKYPEALPKLIESWDVE